MSSAGGSGGRIREKPSARLDVALGLAIGVVLVLLVLTRNQYLILPLTIVLMAVVVRAIFARRRVTRAVLLVLCVLLALPAFFLVSPDRVESSAGSTATTRPGPDREPAVPSTSPTSNTSPTSGTSPTGSPTAPAPPVAAAPQLVTIGEGDSSFVGTVGTQLIVTDIFPGLASVNASTSGTACSDVLALADSTVVAGDRLAVRITLVEILGYGTPELAAVLEVLELPLPDAGPLCAPTP